MKTTNIPQGYNQVMPYLIVPNAAAFIDFTQAVFGAHERTRAMRDETLIMHAEINIGESVIMIADATEQFPQRPAGLFIYVNDCDQVYQKALELGATTASAPSDQTYGRSAGINDAFGNTWWVTSI